VFGDGYEAELIGALLEGAYEKPLWGSFLDCLRRATASDYAVLVFRPPGIPFDEALHLISGPLGVGVDIHRIHQKYYGTAGPPPSRDLLDEGRPYSLEELFGPQAPADGPDAEFYNELVGQYGITAVRLMCVRAASGIDARLTIVRRSEDFTERDDRLMRSIAPILRGVLSQYIAMERERFAASFAADAVRRLQVGWITLDHAGHVLGCDDQGANALSGSGVLSLRQDGRLAARPIAVEREIFEGLGRVKQNPQTRPQAIALSREPWLDMLIMPVRTKSIFNTSTPVAIAYIHSDHWHSADRCEQIAELFALSAKEARLVLALSRGMTIAEAAAEVGLTIESARTYSKVIYSKTGARSLPDLVRLVMRSVLAITPDACRETHHTAPHS
jgi:DNA-binding CsgD family transcriptional regulator